MNSEKHTPGPWMVLPSSGQQWIYIVTEHGGKYVAETTRYAPGPDERHADARLIAAAPDLLKACRAFVEAWEKCLQLEKTDVALRMARAAIAKADTQQVSNV